MSRTWREWVRHELDRRGGEQAAFARSAGLPPSAISQWLSGDVQPSVANVRKFAAAVDAPMLEALVTAGVLTPEEAQQPAVSANPAKLATVEQLLAELGERLGIVATPTTTSPPDAAPRLPQTEAHWSRSATSAAPRTQDTEPDGQRHESSM